MAPGPDFILEIFTDTYFSYYISFRRRVRKHLFDYNLCLKIEFFRKNINIAVHYLSSPDCDYVSFLKSSKHLYLILLCILFYVLKVYLLNKIFPNIIKVFLNFTRIPERQSKEYLVPITNTPSHAITCVITDHIPNSTQHIKIYGLGLLPIHSFIHSFSFYFDKNIRLRNY